METEIKTATPVQPLVAENNPPVSVPKSKLLLVGLAIILAGVGTGFTLSKATAKTGGNTNTVNTEMVNTEKEVGIKDTKTFGDSATGTLETGGLNGEGTHHLTRPGGPSQTVYLISSVVDLEEFSGKKVEVFGQTLKAQRVGWLMDVGRIKILE